MGVVFENITLPKDQDGIDIPGIAGYEILRGSREGNKTIIAKGMVNNFRTFKPRGALAQNTTGLYANYPYNTIIPIGSTNSASNNNYLYNDPYIKNEPVNGTVVNQNIPTDIFTFHSPDTMFRTPFLSTTEFKVYGTLNGYANMAFQEPNGHPKWKLLSNAVVAAMMVGGVIETVIAMTGKRTYNMPQLAPYTEQYRGTGGLGAINLGASATGSGTFISGTSTPGSGGRIDDSAAQNTALGTVIRPAVNFYNAFVNNYYQSGQALADVFIGLSLGYENTFAAQAQSALLDAVDLAGNDAGIVSLAVSGTIELPRYAYLDPISRGLGALNALAFYFAEGAELVLKTFYAFIQYQQFALQQVSHGFYGNMTSLSTTALSRFRIEDSFYIRDNVQ
jgi:hypothetical protein